MLGHELAVEQREAAGAQARDQPGERDLGRVRPGREHAFAEKGAAEPDPVEPADQLALAPHLDRMGVAGGVEQRVAALDLGVDPGLLAIGAAAEDGAERPVRAHLVAAGTDRLAQRAGEMEAVERQDRAAPRLDPIDVAGVAAVRHREDPDRVGAQQKVRVDDLHRARVSPPGRPVNLDSLRAGRGADAAAAPPAGGRGARGPDARGFP